MKGNLRKSIAILLALMLTFTIVGCAKGGTSSNTNASSTNSGGQAAGGEKAKEPAKKNSKYPEKDIEFVVGYGSGGYNDWAQALKPFIEKYLPHKVNIIVKNIEGAGGVIAANSVHKAKPDGYTIGIYNMIGLAGTQAARKVEYDLNNVTWLARVATDNTIVTVSKKSSYNSIADFKKQEKPAYVMSTKGLAGNSTITGAITLHQLGVKWKPLNHNGTSESILAVIRGDADITWGSFESQQQYLDNGDLKMVLYYGEKRHPKYPNVPIPSEVGFPKEFNESFNSQRLIGAPPGLPADIKAILEEAIKKAMEDPEFQALIKKQKMSSDYLPGKDGEKLTKDALKQYQDYKDIIAELTKK